MEFFAWFESTLISTWAREIGWVFFGSLTMHSLALGLVVGINVFIALRLLGFAQQIPLATITAFDRTLVLGLIVVVVSGVLLLLAYPAKALTNPVFYVKLSCIAAGLCCYRLIFRPAVLSAVPSGKTYELNFRWLAGLCLALWVLSIFAGRFLAYTNSVLLASDFF